MTAYYFVRSAGHRACTHKVYRLTCLEFEAVLRRSGNRCDLCNTAAADTPRGVLCIDHDSRIGWAAVRGMLCDKCNAHMKFVDAGTRPVGQAELRYYRDSWFVILGWYTMPPTGWPFPLDTYSIAA